MLHFAEFAGRFSDENTVKYQLADLVEQALSDTACEHSIR